MMLGLVDWGVRVEIVWYNIAERAVIVAFRIHLRMRNDVRICCQQKRLKIKNL